MSSLGLTTYQQTPELVKWYSKLQFKALSSHSEASQFLIMLYHRNYAAMKRGDADNIKGKRQQNQGESFTINCSNFVQREHFKWLQQKG